MKRVGRLYRVAAVVVAAIFFLSAGTVFAATELEEKQAELKQLEAQIRDQRNRLQSKQKQEKSVLSEIQRLDAELAKTEKELDSLEKQMKATENSVRQAENDLADAEARLAQRQDYLGKRIRAIYENGTVSLLDVLLQASDFSDFVNRYSLLQEIIRQDTQVLSQVKAEKAQVMERKQKLEAQKVQLSRITQQTTLKRNTVENRASEREKLLSQVQKERKAYEAALNELEATSRELETIIRNLSSGSSGKAPTKGSMIWPVNGRLSSAFGNRFHPILKVWKLHTGQDIAVPTGTPVKAAASGKVIVSKSLSGYGNTIIIDHGGGISTLYGHNSVLVAKVGQQVRQGDVIAKAGSTGFSTGPHCHFEVRVDGSPVNPLQWLP